MIKLKRSTKITLFIVAACLITGGTAIGILVVATWGEINYENTYYYNPSSPAPIERININSDIGSVLIKYNTTPTDYYVQIDLDIHIAGIFVKGSSLWDFFNQIIWENGTTQVTTFTLDAKATTWFIFIQKIHINVTLRTDVVYNINSYSGTGSTSMNVPDNIMINNTNLATSTGSVSLTTAKNITFQGDVGMSSSTGSVALIAKHVNFTRDLVAYTSTGSLTLNFTNCIIGGDLVGTASTGSISFSSYNMKYMKDHTWSLETSTSSISVRILQFIEMGANVTGSISTSTGSISVYYRDILINVGALFSCSTSTGSNTYTPIGFGGFTESGINPKTITSSDYSTASNYYTFGLSTSTGSITVAAESL
ncbi:MAG: hypothetical protein JSV62_10105 [Promethearchaeota archaeon]|nr:MAG: hypothetical protein JSV62_10105 [Candidatus Lokiarchaeota archaeon]